MEPRKNNDVVLDLRAVFGVHARVTVSSAASGGEYVEMDCTAEPGSRTLVHYHPEQEETFRVLEGTLELLRDGRWTAIGAGEALTVPKRAKHAWRNAGALPVRFINVHRPALGFQAHMETLDHLARAGKIRGTSDVRSVIYMSMSARQHRPDVAVKPPQWVINLMAFIGRRLGFSLNQ